MKSSSIDRIMVGPNNPHNNNTLWVDTSNGEKNAVIKYKGNPLVGGGSGSGSDYQSSGSIVKDMIEQGPNFNWAKYAIDIPSLPCFKPEAEWPHDNEPSSLIADGYLAGDETAGYVVKVTGDNPHVELDQVTYEPIFTDCEPIVVVDDMVEHYQFYLASNTIPIRGIAWGGEAESEICPEGFVSIVNGSSLDWWFYIDYQKGYLLMAMGG